MRVGIGYDAHALVEGRELFLGGLRIPHERGLQGHSDGDVLLHAISDALLGAASLSDIGVFFPDTDQTIKGIESEKILARAIDAVRGAGFELVNIDAVVVCQSPKIQPHKEAMRANIARILAVDASRINVKGKTTEGMGFTGRKEGIEAYAVCLLE